MLLLPNVTLCCVDTQSGALAERALRLSMAGIRFGQALLFADRDTRLSGVTVVRITRFESSDARAQFMLKSLGRHVETDHVLIVQWNGYVIDPSAWNREFARYDYIGAPWTRNAHPVGDGGFSLRSRKLLDALSDPRVVLEGSDEDTICRHRRALLEQEFHVAFAPPAVANRFSFDAGPPVGRPFGFRGLENFWRVVPDGEMSGVLQQLPKDRLQHAPLFQLGRNYLETGQLTLAKAIFEKAVTNDPRSETAARALAAARMEASRSGLAGPRDPCPCGSGKKYKNCHGRAGARGALPMMSDTAADALADHRVRIAQDLHQRRDVMGAEAIYRSVLAQRPHHRAAQHFLGVLLCEEEDIAHALPLLKTSAEKAPPNADYFNNLAIALTAADRPTEAIEAVQRALAIAPDRAETHNTLGRAYQSGNRIDDAIAAYRRAIAIAPHLIEAHWNLSLMLLLSGDYRAGWPEYEWRLRLPGQAASPPGVVWDGIVSAGLRLLVYSEQGFGDALQFARYIPLLIDRSVEVFVYCHRSVSRLMASIDDRLTVVEFGQALPRVDAHFPLMSLARLYSPSIEDIPARVPYLSSPPDAVSMWRQRLDAEPARRKIGLAWAGRTRTLHEKRRPIPVTALAVLAALPDTSFVSLQKDDEAGEIGQWPGPRPMVDWTSELHDFADTAALVQALDLVVTIDTGIAHLAGALGRPTCVLLPFAPDWRWMMNRADSPWYPTVRLLRQESPGAWGPVVNQLMKALQ